MSRDYLRNMVVFGLLVISGSGMAAIDPALPMEDALPVLSLWVQVWSVWLILITLSSLFFVRRHRSIRWSAAAIVALLLVILLLGLLLPAEKLTVGLVSLLHVIFWTPIVVYLTKKIGELEKGTVFGKWCVALLLSLWISLVFDFQAAASWMFAA